MSRLDDVPSNYDPKEWGRASSSHPMWLKVATVIFGAIVAIFAVYVFNEDSSNKASSVSSPTQAKSPDPRGDEARSGISGNDPRQDENSGKPCNVPSLLSKSQFKPPSRPTGMNLDNFRRTIENDPNLPSETKEQLKQQAIQADLKNDTESAGLVEIDTFDPDTAIGGQLNTLLVEINQTQNEFLALNRQAEDAYKASYYASGGTKATDTLRSEKLYEIGQGVGANADRAKTQLKDLAEKFASSWQELDDCYRQQFAGKTVFPQLPNDKEPDAFAEIDHNGGLRAVLVHNPDHGGPPIRIFPWEW